MQYAVIGDSQRLLKKLQSDKTEYKKLFPEIIISFTDKSYLEQHAFENNFLGIIAYV